MGRIVQTVDRGVLFLVPLWVFQLSHISTHICEWWEEPKCFPFVIVPFSPSFLVSWFWDVYIIYIWSIFFTEDLFYSLDGLRKSILRLVSLFEYSEVMGASECYVLPYLILPVPEICL